MQSIATYTTSTRLQAQRRAAQATLATSGCIATRSVPTLQRRKAVEAYHIAARLLHETVGSSNTETPLQHTCTALHCLPRVLHRHTAQPLQNLCSTPGCSVNFNDSGTTCCSAENNLLQRLHRGGDDWLVSGHGDAFADRRHRSGGSRAHRIDKEPPISSPTCRRRLMLFHTCGHKGMCRQTLLC